MLDLSFIMKSLKFRIAGESLKPFLNGADGLLEAVGLEKCSSFLQNFVEQQFLFNVCLPAGCKLCETNKVGFGGELGEKLLRFGDHLGILLLAHQLLESIQ